MRRLMQIAAYGVVLLMVGLLLLGAHRYLMLNSPGYYERFGGKNLEQRQKAADQVAPRVAPQK